jgi:hypothetical protein
MDPMNEAPTYIETELTPEIIESVVARVTDKPMWPRVAAGELGVPGRIFDEWLQEGEQAAMEGRESLERELFERLHQAESVCEGKLVNELDNRVATSKYFQGYMALLERRFGARWAKREAESTGETRFEDTVASLLSEMERREKTEVSAH